MGSLNSELRYTICFSNKAHVMIPRDKTKLMLDRSRNYNSVRSFELTAFWPLLSTHVSGKRAMLEFTTVHLLELISLIPCKRTSESND